MRINSEWKEYLLPCFMFALILIINGCATTQNYSSADDEKFQNVTTQKSSSTDDEEFKKAMNSWIGVTKKQRILEAGPPATISSDGDNGEILVYEDLRRALIDGTYVTIVHKKMFYVNSDGIIYHWRYDRSGREGF